MDPTVKTRVSTLPVISLRAEVVSGADQGMVCTATGDNLTIGTADSNDLVLTDSTVSGFHVELSRAHDGILVVDHGSTNGTRVGGLRVHRGVASVGSQLTLGRSVVQIGDGDSVDLEIDEADTFGGVYGRTPIMRRLIARSRRAAQATASVLLVGESGTGKEVLARALHDHSPRAKGPFITVDCGALAPNLVASELFGHERGAFTGAVRQHEGAFERAQGGTILLDEIGELSESLQASLLGVLERRRFRRVGGTKEIDIDVRVIAATHRDLRAAVNGGSFRLDLYYRIAAVLLQVPPLRDRAADIPALVDALLRETGFDGSTEEVLPTATVTEWCQHHWPGNVRELRNLVEVAVAMGEPPSPDAGFVGTSESSPSQAQSLDGPYREARAAVLADFERRYLQRLLERAENNVSRAARDARMDRSYLISLLHKHGLR